MSTIDQLSINTIRFLSVDAVEKAKSGHPGMPMGAAPMAYILWKDFIKFNPNNPNWTDRDRFVLSAGHGSALLYSLLHMFGYDLSIEDLKKFRQWESKTPGHPEYRYTPGVETTTGPLGQGISTAVGMAMGEQILAAKFNQEDIELVDHHTYVIVGDGDLMEGVASEAASLAGHLKLGKLICLYDDNEISIEGSTELAFTEEVAKRFEAYGWQVLNVEDGNDIAEINQAIQQAKQEEEKPTLIKVRTVIGFGSPNKAGSADVHGAPLGLEEAKLAKEGLGWSYEPNFHVPQEVEKYIQGIVEEKKKEEDKWKRKWQKYQQKYPELAREWTVWHNEEIDAEILNDENLLRFKKDSIATRAASGEILNKLASKVPNLVGGSADLAPSNNTYLKDMGDFSWENRRGRNLRFGVREHAMGAIVNGLYLHGGLRSYCGTFLIFSDYMRPAVRLSALMEVPAVYIFTHDSIALGEDGPTHQPIEQMMSLRLIPGLRVFRPADAKETAFAWISALREKEHPTVLALSRQNLPILPQSNKDALRGAYIIQKERGEKPDLIIMATGSEVHLAIQAYEQLQEKGVDARIVSMPCWEIFEEQSHSYKEEVLPSDVLTRLAVEAGQKLGWERYTGIKGDILGIETFGASAPGEIVLEKYGFTVENLVQHALKMLDKG
ncbi:transketolase [Irregularibacter muris]|uniref:Transketolase n=1 Tax=Irregularibacter muris TaxID=1796619 RepID=A0AAE3HEH0_9FIRM|nr:transketolase [Irregularibacter muris]MCR1898977.1 transketolase [Irregularibacter muris]